VKDGSRLPQAIQRRCAGQTVGLAAHEIPPVLIGEDKYYVRALHDEFLNQYANACSTLFG
jgi:hypothetical protein